MRISDWSSDVCSSDLHAMRRLQHGGSKRLHRIEMMAIEAEIEIAAVDALQREPVDDGRRRLALQVAYHAEPRSEARRVGKECISPCRYRWWPYPKQNQNTQA